MFRNSGGAQSNQLFEGALASLNPEQRLEAWLKWGEQVHDLEVVPCRAESDASQVVGGVTLNVLGHTLNLVILRMRPFSSKVFGLSSSEVCGGMMWLWFGPLLYLRASNPSKLDVLQMFIDRRESSFFIGSYESIYFDDALMMRGHIYESLTQPLMAREAYLLLVESAPKSRLCDDASYRAAMLLPLERRAGFGALYSRLAWN